MIPNKHISNLHALSLLVAAGAVLLLSNITYTRNAYTQDRESISITWKRPMKEPICLSMTQDGKFYGTIDRDGLVQFYNRNGSIIWKQRVEGATDMMIAKNGANVLVYSKLNPVYQNVYFYRGDGRMLWKHQVDGCIWSGDVSPNGDYATVATGKRFVYVYMPDASRPRYRRWRLNGIGHCVAFTPDNMRLIVGTWQESSLLCYDREGKFHWRVPHDTEIQYDLHPSMDGSKILGILPGKQIDPKLELSLWNSGGKQLWTRKLEGFDGHALVSPKSQYVAVSYAGFLKRKDDTDIIERKVAVFKANGELWWEKGGLFFGPRLVALSPKGSSVIVWDGEKSLYNIDKRGRILSKLSLKGRLRKTIASDDGRRIMLYCGDGYLYLLSVGDV